METIPAEYWIVFQIVFDLLLIVLILYFQQNLRREIRRELSKEAVDYVSNHMEPALKDAEKLTKEFDTLLEEKKRLIIEFDRKLEERLVKLKTIMDQADKLTHDVNRYSPPVEPTSTAPVKTDDNIQPYRHHQTIYQYYQKGLDISAIAEKLSIPRGEVELVIEMKKKMKKDITPRRKK